MVSTVQDFNKQKLLDVDDTGGQTVDKAQRVLLVGGDDSTTGNGDIIIDFTNISDAQDIAIYDQNDNLLDYEIEELDTTAETAVIHCYNSWIRDGTTQAKVAYGDNSDNTDNSVGGVGSNPWSNTGESSALTVQLLNETNYPTDTALDSSPNNNDGAVTGATSVDTPIDGGASFDGVDDVIDVDEFGPESGDLTLTGYVKYSQLTDATRNLCAHDTPNTGNEGLRTGQGGSNNDEHIAGGEDSNGNFTNIFGPTITQGEWYHYALTYDDSTNELEFFVDGVSQGTATSSAGFDPATTFFLGAVGTDTDGGTNGEFEGDIAFGKLYTEVRPIDKIQADYDASPKGGQVFFSQQAAEPTTQTVALLESTGTGTTPNPQVAPGNVNIAAPVTQTTGVTPNPAVFSDLFVSVPVSQGNSQSPTPTVVAGNTDIALQESIGAGVTPNPAVTIGNTIRLTPSTATGTTPNPSVKGGVINLAVPSSTGTGTTPNPELLFDQVVSAKVSQGIGNTPEPQVTGEAVTITMPVTTADSNTPNPTVSIEIVPRDSSTLSSIKRDQSKTLSGDINK